MAKTPSDKLYRLIKGLTPAEKRYFKLFIRGKPERDSKYLQLFDAMGSMEQFDDEALRSIIYPDQRVESRKYSELKAYLYELLLKSLQSFDEKHSIHYRLNHYLQSVGVLFRRGQYDSCKELLVKASKVAQQYECFTHLLEIIGWEKHLAYTRMDVDFLHKQFDQLQYTETRALEQLRNMAAYRKLFFQVYTTIKREAQHRGEERMARLQNLVRHELLSDPDQALSHKARVLHYRTLNLYYYAALEPIQFYETGKKLIEILESQAHFLKENLSDYIAAISNFILSCGLLKRYDEVRKTLRKLQKMKPLTEDDRRKIHRQYYTNTFVLCIFTGAFEDGRQEMERCQLEVRQFDQHDYETASFYFQYCCICFGCGDFNAALDYLNKWLNQPRTVEREDLQSLARMLSLIIHFEMGNTVLLESLLRAATRFLQKKNRLYDLERRFFQFMSELMRAPSKNEEAQAFKKMQDDLSTLSTWPGAQALLQTFDLEAWLEAKITNQTFAAAVKAKWQTQQSLPV
jgi:tetratricopeptide (TPR) repeat protein